MFTQDVVIGNACSLLAMITDSVSSTRKTTKEVLLFQSLGQLIYCIGTIVLKGYSAAVQNAVSLARNVVAIRNINSKALEWTLVVLGVVLGVVFNNLGLIGLLPVLANLQYTLAIFRFRDNDRALKISFLICVTMFAVFNAAILNIVGVCANAVIFTTSVVALLRDARKRRNRA